MTTQTPLTVESFLSKDVLALLGEIAHNQQSSTSEVIKDAVDGYLNEYAALERAVQKGRDDFKAGRVFTHDQVKESIRKLGYYVD